MRRYRWAFSHVLACAACTGEPDPEDTDKHIDTQVSPDTQVDSGADTAETIPCHAHVFEDILIPMRDGEELAGYVRKPSDPDCKLPTVLVYTPYDMSNTLDQWLSDKGTDPLFDSKDYAFVVVDWRGRFANASVPDGKAGTAVEQNGWDGADIIEWIAEQSFSNGHVGMYGPSALGGVQFNIAEQQPEHLSAIVPIFASPVDGYEKWNPGGVLRREYLSSLDLLFGGYETILADYPTMDGDTNEWFWNYMAGLTPLNPLYEPDQIEVPVLHVHGFFDLSAGHTLAGSERLISVDEKYLLIGEWHHFASGGESSWGASLTDQEELWSDEEDIIQSSALAFFDRFMRDLPSEADDWAPVRYQRGEDWLEAETWPPAGVEELTFYLGEGSLQETAPETAELDYDYDPLDNCKTSIGGQTLHYEYEHGPHYQVIEGTEDDCDGKLVDRNDTLTFVTEPLEQAVELAGPITASLQVRTTGTDTHFYIRLVDVDEEGHLMLTDGARRLALYQGLDTLSEITPGELYTVPIDATNPQSWRFEAGHRIGLIVNSHHWERFEKSTNVADTYLFDETVAVEATNSVVLGESTLTLTVEP
jgi:predicted acyl esterase